MGTIPVKGLGTRGAGRLPPPPAPTARDANPWKFSETARRAEPAEPAEPSGVGRLLQELEQARLEREGGGAPPSSPEPAASEPEPSHRRESAFNKIFPVVILLIMFGSFAREMIETQGDGAARLQAVLALVFVAVFVGIFLALRTARRRRRRR